MGAVARVREDSGRRGDLEADECGSGWVPRRPAVVGCAVRERDERRVGGGAVSLAAERPMVRVGFASRGGQQGNRQASAPRTAVAAIRRISTFRRCGGTRATFSLVRT